ncbi:MAG: protein kinase [Myxococcota bacterium]
MRDPLSGPSTALIVDPEPNMARHHAAELEQVGIACRVVHALPAATAALEAQGASYEMVFVSLELRAPALETFIRRARSEGVARIVGVSFEHARPAPVGLDTVIEKPTPPSVVREVARHERAAAMRAPAELVTLLIGAGALGREGDGMTHTVTRLLHATQAHAVLVYQRRPRRRWVAVREAATDATDRAHAAKLEPVVRRAAAVGARYVGPARLTGGESEHVGATAETVFGWRGDVDTGLTLGLVYAGCVHLPGSVNAMFTALVERLAREVSWQLVQDRLMTELDAVRDVGGLDPLLGIWGRGLLSRLLHMMHAACARDGSSLSVAVIDVVGMGAINDRFGHREGDGVLKYVAELVVYVTRTDDAVARYDGDAVAVVFDGATPIQAQRVVERFQAALESQPYQTEDNAEIDIATTAAVAVVGPHDDPDLALERAARAAASRVQPGVTLVAEVAPSQTVSSSSASDGLAPRRGATPGNLGGVTLGGAYRILHEIGSGGGGGVYRGEDLALRRPVAVKVLRPDLARDETLVERFRDEAATLASLRHPHLVQVYAFGVDDGLAYFVMELVEGESLFDTIVRCRREANRLAPARVAQIARQLGAALQTLHQSGVRHRDVKPANILMDPFRDRAVLVDVGIAARAGERNVMAGTPGYMAPEAATEADVDASADVYGLAATLYELLTLTPPWPEHDDPIVVLRRQQAGPPRPPSRYRVDVGPVDDVLRRALEPEPHHRYPDVARFVAAFVDALRELDDAIPPASAGAASSPGIPSSSGGKGGGGVAPSTPTPLGSAPTLAWNQSLDSQAASTRSVVFRCLPRVVGARPAIAWRVTLGRTQPHLAEALSPSAPPLGWLPSAWLVTLLQEPPPGSARQPAALGRDLGRATVRATFRRFFPVSVATLSPSAVLQALPQIWRQYHTWGEIQLGRQRTESSVVILRHPPDTPATAVLKAWTQGMLEQLVVMAGADEAQFQASAPAAASPPPAVAAAGDRSSTPPSMWQFEGTWTWSPGSDRAWR